MPMLSSIFLVVKTIFDIAAYSSLIILVYVFIYVRRGNTITLKYVEDDDYDNEEENEEY